MTQSSASHLPGTSTPRPGTRSPSQQRPFIAADVGGTHARIGLVRRGPDVRPGSAANGDLDVLHYRKFACADYPSLSAILDTFVREGGVEGADAACLACAGIVLGDKLVNANLPWQVSISALKRDLGMSHVVLVNDFEALAYAAQYHPDDQAPLVAGKGSMRADQPRLVVGPGTGLGAAVLLPPPHAGVLATEAGHAALAPRTALELQVVRALGHGLTHVPNEQILSGPGLATLYRVLCEIREAPASLASPSEITQSALSSTDALATECVDLFCGWLGGMVGDLVLLYGAHGGVFLAGGFLPQILPILHRSTFAERFYGKGMLRDLLEQTPVRLIEHGQLGMTGAARWFIDNEYQTNEA